MAPEDDEHELAFPVIVRRFVGTHTNDELPSDFERVKEDER
jgi:hypothetical protein